MSAPSGTAARLVGRAGRRAIGRRHSPGLVELSLPPSGAQASPSGEPAPAATPGARPAPPVARTSIPSTASGRAQLERAADASTATPPTALAPASVEPTATDLPARQEPHPLVPPLVTVQPPGPTAPRTRGHSSSPAALPTAALSVAASREAVAPLTVAPTPLVPTATPAAPAAATPRPPAPPPVVIDRIEIVTPPARPPAPDPLASVAARPAGRSRHAGAR